MRQVAIELRPHQILGKRQLRQGYTESHRRLMLVAPTGSGKTVFAADLALEASRKQTKTAFVVDRNTLVNQTSKVFDYYGIDHGIVQANHPRWRPYLPVQICSIQTLERRGDLFNDFNFKLVMIDECHTVRAFVKNLLSEFPDGMTAIGLTATPFTPGLGRLYDHLACPVTHNQLVERKLLVPIRYYAATQMDVSSIDIKGGEWSDVSNAKAGEAIVGDIVTEWEKACHDNFGGPVKTLVFSPTVDYGAVLKDSFAARGHNFQQLSYKDTDEYREETLNEFRKPEPECQITGLISVEVLAKGFDVPDVRCGVGARAYRKSFSGHIQQLGRVARISPDTGKEYAIWLDHVGNVARFYSKQQDLYENGVKTLKDGKLSDKVVKEPEDKEREEITCGQCKSVIPPSAQVCPYCGHERRAKSLVQELPGQMVEINGKVKKLPDYLLERESVWRQLCQLVRERNYPNDQRRQAWCQANYISFYGEAAKRRFEKTTPANVTTELRNRILRDTIAYSRKKKRKKKKERSYA